MRFKCLRANDSTVETKKRISKDHSVMLSKTNHEGASSGDGRVRELIEYMEPGLLPSGTFREPLTEASVTLGKTRVLTTNGLHTRDTQTQAVPPRYSHIITPTCRCGSNGQAETKENRVLLLKEGARARKLCRASECHQTQCMPPMSVSVWDCPTGPQGFSLDNASYLDIGIPAFL